MCYECSFEEFVQSEKDRYKSVDEKTFNDTFLDKVKEKVKENPLLVSSNRTSEVRQIMFEIKKDKDFLLKIATKDTILSLLEAHGSYSKTEMHRVKLSVYLTKTDKKGDEKHSVVSRKRGDWSEVYAYRLSQPAFKLCSKYSW